MLAALANNWWALVVRGLLAIALGAFAWLRPEFFWASLIVVFGVYAAVDGVFAIVAAAKDATGGRWVHLLEGIIGIGAGALVILFPAMVGTAIVLVIGLWAIVTGALELVSAVRLRQEIDDEWLLGIGGVLSIGLGVILVLQPRFGQIITTYLLGTYAVLFGCLMLGLGMRVRGLRVS